MTTKRFAFYGRVSTEDQQDPESSKGWQLSRSRTLIEPAGGVVVAEYFDIGRSRSLPWKRRPEAAILLDALARPDRGFEAVVIGEPARAFYGNQFGLTFPVFAHYGVELWVPEVGGAVDPGSDAHDLVMSLYGGMSKGERNRIKIRVRSAMAAQARTEGRFLGGRPPYGYRLADAGPHPNPGKAAVGQRLHRLEPDPGAAPVVRRIFELYAGGGSYAGIARQLDAAGVPCPSAHDRGRNPHRRAEGWKESAVRAVLANSRYTGRQVWNRQRRDEVLLDVDDVALGHMSKMRWNDEDAWIVSETLVHEPLVDDELAVAVRERLADRARSSGPRAAHAADHEYSLRGLLSCALCGRRMQGTMRGTRAYYRCPTASVAHTGGGGGSLSLYLREAVPVHLVDEWLAVELAAEAQAATAAELADRCGPTPDEQNRIAAARTRVAEIDRKIARLAEAFEAGLSPDSFATFDRRYRAERAGALAETVPTPAAGLSAEEFRDALADAARLAERLERASSSQRRAIYDALGLQLRWDPAERSLHARVAPRGAKRGVGGGT